MGFVERRRMTGRWSDPQSGPGERWWWRWRDWLFVKTRSGFPVPVLVKVVLKSGPRNRSLFC